jgi:predicted transcriptional regulator
MTRKPKVSTRTKNFLEKKDKVLNILHKHKEGVFPKHLSLYTGINHNSVRSMLKIMEREGLVKKHQKIRGVYLVVDNSPHSLLCYNFHNLTLVYELKEKLINKTEIIENNVINLFKYSITFGKGKQKVSMILSTDYPFNVSSLCLAGELFRYKVKEKLGFAPQLNKIIIKGLEINKDYLGIKLEGVNCITLESLVALFRIYQKKAGVREELKLKIPVDMDFLDRVLKKGVCAMEEMSLINVSLNNQKKIMKMLENLNSKINSKIYKDALRLP